AVRLGQRTWRRSARAPYWPHCGQARCGRCLAPHAGLAQFTRDGATAFHCERRWRVLLRDIFRFGTATVFSSIVRFAVRPTWPPTSAGRLVVRLVVLETDALQLRPPGV